MTDKEKARELVEKFKDYVHGYVGSSMLINHEYPEQILAQAKKAATMFADEMLQEYKSVTFGLMHEGYRTGRVSFWINVKAEINNIQSLESWEK